MNKHLIDRLKAQGDFIDFKMSPQFHANRERHGDAEDYCIVCGKAVKHVRHGLHVFYGSSAVTEAGAAAIREEEGGGGTWGSGLSAPTVRATIQNYVRSSSRVKEKTHGLSDLHFQSVGQWLPVRRR